MKTGEGHETHALEHGLIAATLEYLAVHARDFATATPFHGRTGKLQAARCHNQYLAREQIHFWHPSGIA